MNNYTVTEDYYNYVNNNYNQPCYNQTNKQPELYDPYNGYIRGNMFPNLYNGYKLNRPLDIEPLNEQAQLLTYIDALGFAAHDINLYLDLYPDNRDMIELFNQYRMETNRMMEEYQKTYGPLLVNSDASKAIPWAWNKSPWPWENK